MKPASAPLTATSSERRGSHHMRPLRTAALGLASVMVALALLGTPARASHSQVALFEEDAHLLSDPVGTMGTLRQLGVGEARVYLEWSYVAPDPYNFTKPKFNSASPAGYNWARYDKIVSAARQQHIQLDFVLSGGAPHWAIARGYPHQGDNIHYAWKPSATEWGNFVHAVLLRYGQSVHTWEIYNEPNFGDDLAPQSVHGVATGPAMYRNLVDAAWRAFSALHRTHDKILIGQLTARGLSGGSLPGNFSQTKPLIFARALYCVDRGLRPLRGSAAKAIGCPTTASASRSFTRLHPGLFHASGFGIHPYPQGLPPTGDSSHDPDFITFNTIPRAEATLDGIDRAYHVRGGVPLYNNEYGYVTRPPAKNRAFASPAAAAVYINQAEYLSWLNPRVQSYMQYLLYDPSTSGPSQFFSGLIFPGSSAPGGPPVVVPPVIPGGGPVPILPPLPPLALSADGTPSNPLMAQNLPALPQFKPSYYSYRMPLWLPSPVTRRGRSTEVWGAVRPFHAFGGHQPAQIQWRSSSHGTFRTIANAALRASNGYFDTRVRFPGGGQVQIAWNEPGVGLITSRIASVTVR
jgi:hypothetical protein